MLDRIDKRLKELKKNRSWLAQKIGVTPQTPTNWKTRGVPLDKVKPIAKVLGVTREWLEGEEDSQNEPIFQVRQREISGIIDIPIFDVNLSMGNGSNASFEHLHSVAKIQVTEQFIRENLPVITSPKNLKIATAFGDSMQPTYYDGNPLFIDTGITTLEFDAVYAFTYDGDGYIKRLQRNPSGSIEMISDNKNYQSFTINNGERKDLIIHGLIRGAWSFNKI